MPPSIVVRATYPGANPKVIAETVAAPLEEQINGVENMLYMSSQATTDGVLTLTVTFKIGTNVDVAETQVQNRVQRALPRLPEEVRQIGVVTQKSSPDLTMVVHLVSPDEPLRRTLPAQLRRAQRQGRARAHSRHGPGARIRRGRLRDARMDRPAEAGRAQAHGRRRRRARSASRTSRSQPA